MKVTIDDCRYRIRPFWPGVSLSLSPSLASFRSNALMKAKDSFATPALLT